jgi:tetratricopeptide (TPR) repeat protein
MIWNPPANRLGIQELREQPARPAIFDIHRMLATGRALHQAGRRVEAEALYRRVLALDPNNADGLHLLGVVAQEGGRNELAVELIGKAIARNNRVAVFHCNIGNALHALQRLREAEVHYRRAIKLDPNHAESWNNLGNTLKDQGRAPEAEVQFRRALALRPSYAEAHYNLGNALLDQSRIEEAIRQYRQAIGLNPGLAAAHYNLGHALTLLGRHEDAAGQYRQVVALDPGWAAAQIKLGTALRQLDRLTEAESCFRRAHEAVPEDNGGLQDWAEILESLGRRDEAIGVWRQLCGIEPEQARHWFELGLALQKSGRPGEALASYRRAHAIDPNHPYLRNNLAAAYLDLDQPQSAIEILQPLVERQPSEGLAWINLGSAYRKRFDPQRSVAAFERALATAPDNPLGYSNFGLTLKELQRWDDAQIMFERALAIDPNYVGARWNLAMTQLLRGDYVHGWINHEARWEGSPELRGKPRGGIPQPLWEGESLSGKTLFVWGEQGFGDALQFGRYVPLIADRVKRDGGRMIYCCFGRLLPLFRRSFGQHVETIIPDDVRPLPDFDLHCPLLSLPLRFGTTLESLPAETPYLLLDQGKVDAWRGRLSGERRLKVGLVWSGKGDHQRNPFRAVGLQAYATAFKEVQDVAFYSLQFGAPPVARRSASRIRPAKPTPRRSAAATLRVRSTVPPTKPLLEPPPVTLLNPNVEDARA